MRRMGQRWADGEGGGEISLETLLITIISIVRSFIL